MCLKLLASLKGHCGAIWSILWGISGNYLISIGVDSSLIIWGPHEIFFPMQMYKKSSGEITYFNSWVKIYQIKISKVLRTFRCLTKKVNSNYFSISDFMGNSYLWDIIFLKCSKICIVEIKHTLRGHSSEMSGPSLTTCLHPRDGFRCGWALRHWPLPHATVWSLVNFGMNFPNGKKTLWVRWHGFTNAPNPHPTERPTESLDRAIRGEQPFEPGFA